MKKLLLLATVLISLSQLTHASHMIGGTIYWQCLSNGQYQFHMEVYVDCSGASWSFRNEEKIDIVGNPLPLNSNGYPFSSIKVFPDSAKWINSNLGQLSLLCDTVGNKNQHSCENRDQGFIQSFFYKSEPIILKGIPPSKGWKFYWESICCRSSMNVKNVSTYTGNMLLRAAMYPTKNVDPIDSCFYSSPQFISPPSAIICRGEYTYNNIGIQKERDSISFSFDRPLNDPINSPDTLPYFNGFSATNPTPDFKFNYRNQASVLNPNTGNINLAVYNGSGGEKYLSVIKIDSWREGKIVTTSYREFPLSIVDCDLLLNGKPNNKPVILFSGKQQSNLSLNFQAGEKINFSIEITDNDYKDMGVTFQSVSLKPYGQLFSTDFKDTASCDFPPCAVLRNSAPSYDSAAIAYRIVGQRSISSNFEWQTNCSHLGENGKSKTYLFYYQAQDDHCSVPQSVGGVISITLQGNNQKLKASMDCIRASNGSNAISWNLNSISADNLIQWYVFGSVSENGTYQLLDSLAATSSLNYIDSSSNNQFYFVLAKNYSCDSSISLSTASDTIKSTYDGLKVENTFDCVLLTWNQERSSYASDEIRKYYVYRETQTSSGFELIDSVVNSNQYCDKSNVCGATIRYYVTADLSTAICNFNVDTVSIILPIENLNSAVKVLNNTLVAKDVNGNYQWFDCHAKRIIPGETAQTFIPKDTGSYALILSRYGCSDTSKCIPLFPVGIAPLPLSQQLTYYPNPTSGKLTINLDQKTASMQVQVRNIQGQLLKELQFVNSNNLQLELPQDAGIYFIQLTNQKGERANLKVVKQ